MTRAELENVRRATLACCLLVAVAPARAAGQLRGMPVLQNAFANPGFTAAVNLGVADQAVAYGAAIAWAPGGARFQLSAGLAYTDRTAAKGGTAYGARVMVPLLTRAAFGVAAFAGAGAASADSMDILHYPAGLAAGYRRRLGDRRALSVHGAVFYAGESRRPPSGDRATSGRVRGAAGLDLALSPRIGLTLGHELGGADGGVTGVAVSFAFGR